MRTTEKVGTLSATRPITGPSFLVGYRDDHNLNLVDSIEDVEGKPFENEFAGAVIREREAVRRLSDSGHSAIDSVRKCD